MHDSDKILPQGPWRFDSDVANAFEDMLTRSIPQYEVMRRTCFDLACHFRQQDTAIIDLGCSRGDALAPLIQKFDDQNQYLGVDISGPMIEIAHARYAGLSKVHIKAMDLRHEFPLGRASVIQSILTLQFIPIEYRQQIIQRIYDSLLPGGAFIFVEKVLGNSARLDTLMVEQYLMLKSANGYTSEQIDRKRASLEGVLVPVTAHWNEELLTMAGFKQVDCFWRWMNFAGWVGIK